MVVSVDPNALQPGSCWFWRTALILLQRENKQFWAVIMLSLVLLSLYLHKLNHFLNSVSWTLANVGNHFLRENGHWKKGIVWHGHHHHQLQSLSWRLGAWHVKYSRFISIHLLITAAWLETSECLLVRKPNQLEGPSAECTPPPGPNSPLRFKLHPIEHTITSIRFLNVPDLL